MFAFSFYRTGIYPTSRLEIGSVSWPILNSDSVNVHSVNLIELIIPNCHHIWSNNENLYENWLILSFLSKQEVNRAVTGRESRIRKSEPTHFFISSFFLGPMDLTNAHECSYVTKFTCLEMFLKCPCAQLTRSSVLHFSWAHIFAYLIHTPTIDVFLRPVIKILNINISNFLGVGHSWFLSLLPLIAILENSI